MHSSSRPVTHTYSYANLSFLFRIARNFVQPQTLHLHEIECCILYPYIYIYIIFMHILFNLKLCILSLLFSFPSCSLFLLHSSIQPPSRDLSHEAIDRGYISMRRYPSSSGRPLVPTPELERALYGKEESTKMSEFCAIDWLLPRGERCRGIWTFGLPSLSCTTSV